jgi:hypothetical protein
MEPTPRDRTVRADRRPAPPRRYPPGLEGGTGSAGEDGREMAHAMMLLPLVAMNVVALNLGQLLPWIHIANVLYLLSYSVRDILWLRILTVVAIFTAFPYYFSCSERGPLWDVIAWQSLFATVNIFQIVLLVRERWPVTLQGIEREIYEKVFRSLTPGEFRKLLTQADWRDVEPGTRLVREGEVVDEMLLLCEGEADVVVGEKVVAGLGAGQFIGEMSFLTQEKASANVDARTHAKLVGWQQDKLKAFLERQTGLDYKLRGTLGQDMVRKLKAAAQRS